MKGIFKELDLTELKKHLPTSKRQQEQLNKFILTEENLNSSSRGFMSIIETWNGKLVERVFGYSITKARGKEIREVIRRIEGSKNYLARDLIRYPMTGTFVIWSEESNSYGHKPDFTWREVKRAEWNVQTQALFTIEEVIQMDPSLKYCGLSYIIDIPLSFIEYVSYYRKRPEYEMISKLGFYHLLKDSRFYRRLLRDEKFKKYVLSEREDINTNNTNYNSIINAYRLNVGVTYYENLKRFFDLKEENITNVLIKKQEKITSYVKTQSLRWATSGERDFGYRLYGDYLELVQRHEGTDAFKDKHLYPDDLFAAHDYYVNVSREQEKEEIEKKQRKNDAEFKKTVEQYKGLEYVNSRYLIKLPRNKEDINREGELLNHCLIWTANGPSYYNRMWKEKKLLFFVRKKEEPKEPYYTVEFDAQKLSIEQCRGENNVAATTEVNDFMSEWLNYAKEEINKC